MHASKMKHRLGREKTPVSESSEHVPVTYEHCTHVTGPFFHGTKVAMGIVTTVSVVVAIAWGVWVLVAIRPQLRSGESLYRQCSP